MAMTPKKKMEWMEVQHRLELASSEADSIVQRLQLQAPIDPFKIVQFEKRFLRAGGKNLGNLYDGKLEYRPDRNLFLLFFNRKYDEGRAPNDHHPRTRFSICHELGHYFLPRHRAFLMKKRKPHASRGELQSDLLMEREADTFAASILLPGHLAGPVINQAPLSVLRAREIADMFGVSLVSTVFRAVRLSDFPCAVAGIRNGVVTWMFPSEALINAGIYPDKGFLPEHAREAWDRFQSGDGDVCEDGGSVDDWFQTFAIEGLDEIYVHEEYIPVHSMGTLLVLLTVDEADLTEDEDD